MREPVRPEILRETLDCLHVDLPPAGVKLGMLATPEIVVIVSEYLERLRKLSLNLPIVVDPVIRSSSGRELLAPEGITLLRERLLPLASWVTPNLDELSLLSDLSCYASGRRLRKSGSGRTISGPSCSGDGRSS